MSRKLNEVADTLFWLQSNFRKADIVEKVDKLIGNRYCERSTLTVVGKHRMRRMHDIFEMRKKGASYKQIANRYNLSSARVGQILNQIRRMLYHRLWRPGAHADEVSWMTIAISNGWRDGPDPFITTAKDNPCQQALSRGLPK